MYKGTLRSIVERVDNFDWGDCIYIEKGKISYNTECIVIDPDTVDFTDDGFAPLIEGGKNKTEFCGIQDLQMVLENLLQQTLKPTDKQILNAIVHYYEHDAYIEI